MKDLRDINTTKEDKLAFERFKKQAGLGASLSEMIQGKFKNEYWEKEGEKTKGRKLEKKPKGEMDAKESRWKSKFLIATRFLGHGINELLKKRKGEERMTEEEIIAKRKSMLIRHKALVVKRLDKLKAEEKFDAAMEERKREKRRREQVKKEISKELLLTFYRGIQLF